MSVQALSCAMVIRGVSASEKLLLLVLANYADDRMTCWPSHKRLAEDTCLSQRTILSLLKGLEERRVISREDRYRRDGSRTSDLITLFFSGEVTSPPPEEDDTGPLKSTTPGGAMISPLTSFEPSLDTSEEPPRLQCASAEVWTERLEEAKAVGRLGLDFTAPSLHAYRDLKNLCEPASGQPCTWEEVLSAIEVEAASALRKRKPIRSWTWVQERALTFRDRRLAGLRAPEAVATGPPLATLTDRIAADHAEARRRVLEDGKPN